jgi:hypothetical protein
MKLVLVLLIIAFSLFGEAIIINESLTDSSTSGTKFGGFWTPEGYQPYGKTGHIYFQLPATVKNGYVEFEVKGMDHSKVATDGDHGFFCMYDGRGINEPAQYFNHYKNNFFRWNVHWRQNRAAMKSVVTTSAPNKPLVSGMAVDANRDWSHEPTGSGVSWNPSSWHKIKVEWRNRVFTVYVDGAKKWGVSGSPYDYAPVVHRAWLGSAPNNGNKYACLVQDIIYRNFKLVDYDASSVSSIPTSSSHPIISICPNPARSIINLSINGIRIDEIPFVQVFDVQGKLFRQWQTVKCRPGIYYIKLDMGNKVKYRRVTILK